MKKSMLGIVFMSLGVLLFIVGIVIYRTSAESTSKVEVSVPSHSVASQSISQRVHSAEPISQTAEAGVKSLNQTNRTSEIDRLIDMAIADGVLTENEKSKIRSIAIDYELEEEEIIQLAENKMADLGINSETEIINTNKKNGLDFEKYIIQKFNRKYFKINNWAGDKYVNGYYAEVNQQPDIQLEFSLGNRISKLAVECKWRKRLNRGGIEFASEAQLERYEKFAQLNDMPVFVAIGVGGNGSAPENLYVVNVNECQTNFITAERLKHYEKSVKSNFYFDLEKAALK